MKLDKERVLPIIKAALKEDIGKGDITTSALIESHSSAKASIVTREDCVICGLRIAEWAMAQIDYSVRFKPNCEDGQPVAQGKEIVYVEGHAASIARAERTMLNFLTFLSGIATRTKQYVDRVKPYGVKVMDTRKTLPLLRYIEKYAVSTGGGSNHRMGLYDQALVKDNHIKVTRSPGHQVTSLKAMVETVRKSTPKGTVVEIEAETVHEFSDALSGKPDIIMLDNMSVKEVKACVDIRRISKVKTLLEVSGGITLDTIEDYAKTGIDMISVGALTHSVDAIDMSLEIV